MVKTKKRSRSQSKKGGSASAWGYVYDQVGNGWTQFQNALTLQPGQNLGSQQSNDIEPIGKPNFQNNQSFPTSKDLSLIQRAGKRRSKRSKRSRSKKGGNWGAALGSAIVPFTLLGVQNAFGKRKSKGRKTRKTRRTRRR